MPPSTPDPRQLSLLSADPDVRQQFAMPRSLRFLTWVTASTIAVVVIAMSVLRVDTVISASGTLEPDARLFIVRALRAARVEAVPVRAGDRVREGELLVRLDAAPVEFELAALESALVTASRRIWRDFLEVEGWLAPDLRVAMIERVAPIDHPFDTDAYRQQLAARIGDMLRGFDASVRGVEANIDASRAQLRAADALREVEAAAFERTDRLYRRHAVSAAAHDEARKRLYELGLRVASLRGSIGVLEAEHGRLTADRQHRLNEMIRDRVARLDDQLDEHERLRLRRATLQGARDEFEVRAPFDAVVDFVAIRGAYELLEAGAPLVELRRLYEPDDLQIEFELASSGAVRVRPGMRFRASALGAQRDEHGYLEGRVDYVSLSSQPGNPARIYRVRGADLTIRSQSFVDADHPLLRPGLEVNVDIFVGDRRLVDYLIDPVVRYARSTLREPS